MSPGPGALARVVVVSWNGAHLLPTALDSLERQTVRDRLDVVVVDNGSTDGTAELLATRYPDVRRLASASNLGFAGGAALGMADARCHVVLLNNDAAFAPDAVEHLLRALEAPGVGATTARVLLAGTDPVLVNSTGNVVTRTGNGADRDWRAPLGSESTDPDVFGFYGGAAALRREMLDEVGGFDPWLFLYYEDTDLSWRMRAAGWTVRYVPEAVAHHEHAASSGTDTPVFRYHNTRNSLVVATRHAPLRVAAISAARQSAGWLRAARRGGWASPDAVARRRGLTAHLRRLPRTLGERRRMWHAARVGRRVVARYIGRDAPTS
ncbi:glycosyltransferase family 2 protein [Cellulomonas xiejunii]|uniref:Glycosyltransferase family 2 protein n=1 Tax=Cellulomonas xiejunii TaxID=2968083 RepID=A0ABY5KN72_9CELL|nr:glycosyltransferase family 2 protein [Cellulomonas xiejunii]MCC2320203.1 glycosyltransferase family 2 protein [Cellulomonas xiejunii]UUI70510.1 glycosyltransferase family 2 protein [Cellulomonas xiejunii]